MIRFDLRMPWTVVTRCYTARECSGSQVFAFVSLAYEHPSLLLCENHILVSAEGVQQGDPPGSLLYCVTIQSLVGKFKSNYCMFYFDDGTVSGSANMSFMIYSLLRRRHACHLGLQLKHEKIEVICNYPNAGNLVPSAASDLSVVSHDEAALLSTPLGCPESFDAVISLKVGNLNVMGKRASHLSIEDCLLLLCYSLTIFKLL